MTTNTKQKRAVFLDNISHYIAAVVVILKGLDKIDTPGKTIVGIIFLVIGIVIMLGTIFHHSAEKLLRHFKAFVFALEAIVMAAVGYLYVKEGKQFLPYFFFVASIAFIVALVIYIRKNSNNKIRERI